MKNSTSCVRCEISKRVLSLSGKNDKAEKTREAYDDFDVFWDIYRSSFPVNERRSRNSQLSISANKSYSMGLLEYNGSPAGIIACWDLKDFIFMEHFAIHSDFHGKGMGSSYLAGYVSSLSKPLIIEVDLPADDKSRRRISFYKRLGFIMNDYDYVQPPYESDQKSVSMRLMSFPAKISQKEFPKVRDRLHYYVYGFGCLDDQSTGNNNTENC